MPRTTAQRKGGNVIQRKKKGIMVLDVLKRKTLRKHKCQRVCRQKIKEGIKSETSSLQYHSRQ